MSIQSLSAFKELGQLLRTARLRSGLTIEMLQDRLGRFSIEQLKSFEDNAASIHSDALYAIVQTLELDPLKVMDLISSLELPTPNHPTLIDEPQAPIPKPNVYALFAQQDS